MNDVLVYNGVEYLRKGPKHWIENEVKLLKSYNYVQMLPPTLIKGELCDELERIYSRPKKLERIVHHCEQND